MTYWGLRKNSVREQSKKRGNKGGYQSGQMGQTVNLLACAYGGSNPSPPTTSVAATVITAAAAIFFQPASPSQDIASKQLCSCCPLQRPGCFGPATAG